MAVRYGSDRYRKGLILVEDILLYILGIVIGGLGIYFFVKAKEGYLNLRKDLIKKGVPLTTIQFLEEQALEVIQEIEENFAENYSDDPDGTSRHSVAKSWLSTIIQKGNLEDKVTSDNLDTLIAGTVKGAGFAKGLNKSKK